MQCGIMDQFTPHKFEQYRAMFPDVVARGCVVCFVQAEAVLALVNTIEDQCARRAGKSPAVYVASPSDGAALFT